MRTRVRTNIFWQMFLLNLFSRQVRQLCLVFTEGSGEEVDRLKKRKKGNLAFLQYSWIAKDTNANKWHLITKLSKIEAGMHRSIPNLAMHLTYGTSAE